jgi:hypothetical protein
MGTLILLYHHPEAPRIVQELNERNRRWAVGDMKGYHEVSLTLDIEEATRLPSGAREIPFQSLKHADLYPTCVTVDRLGAYLESHRMPALYALFGYPAWNPEEWYRIPDWVASLNQIQMTLQRFERSRNEHRKHLEAFEEMVTWVIEQRDWDAYYLGWSY